MPTDSLLISIGVTVMFLVFAFALAWADHTTNQWLRNKPAVQPNSNAAEPPQRKAA